MKTKFIILIIIGTVIISSLSTVVILKHAFYKNHFNHFKKIEKKLNLSEEQSKQMKTFILENAPKAMEIFLFEDDKTELKQKLQVLHQEAEIKVKEILSDQQFKKFKKLQRKAMHKRFCKDRFLHQ